MTATAVSQKIACAGGGIHLGMQFVYAGMCLLSGKAPPPP